MRPAVVLAETSLDLTACFITTQLQWQEATDVVLMPNPTNGIRKLSLIRVSKLATLDHKLTRGLLGRLSQAEMAASTMD